MGARYLITGACGGMGSALCGALTAAGDEVWGLDRAEAPADCPWRPVRADLADPGSVEAALAQVKAEAGGLDGVVHMAGVYDLASLAELSEERFLRDFQVNVFGAYRVNKLCLPLLKPGGRILIVTSELAPLDPLPFTGIYAVTKAALEKYAFSLAMELQLLGHRVVVLRPGAVATPLLPESRARLEEFCRETKLYRVPGERFRQIVERVETRSISPEVLAAAALKVLKAKRPRPVYNLNRSPGLLLLSALPLRLQRRLIRRILTEGKSSSPS